MNRVKLSKIKSVVLTSSTHNRYSMSTRTLCLSNLLKVSKCLDDLPSWFGPTEVSDTIISGVKRLV